jgi:S1-C subfamily serine protease
MRQRLFILTITLFIGLLTFGQEQEKIYYNSEWKVCKESKAEYYRLITLDENGKPIGKVKDYYITGELQWEGNVSYVDKDDNSKDISEGLCVWYYENGNKARESTMVNGVENGITTYWHENGKIAREINLKNGDFVDEFFTDCDEAGSCRKVFWEFFGTSNNIFDWPLEDSQYEESIIIPKKGLSIRGKNSGQRIGTYINLPIEQSDNFSIETKVEYKSGEKRFSHGLIWGMKDWDNYYTFSVSGNGSYNISGKMEGIWIPVKEWTQNRYVNNRTNVLKVLKLNDKVHFSINGHLVMTSDFTSLFGNKIGFLNDGKKEVIFNYLKVEKEILDDYNKTPSTNKTMEWKGNGTGFFIDKNGYIATNYHVVEDANNIEIEFIRNGIKKTYSAKVIQSDRQNDLAIIKITDAGFVSFNKLPYNFKTDISDVGSNVFALGYPMALTVMGTEIKFTDGKISSKTGYQGDITTYQTTTPIQPGNSGGPLFDYDGNLIAINSAILRPDVADNVSYSIKSNYLKNLIDVLDYKISLPNDRTIETKILTEKIKILSDYVVLIKVR